MKRQSAHFLLGYVTDGKHVRARCTCGYLSAPEVAQRPARSALARGHDLSVPQCELCGRGDANAPALRLPASLAIISEDGGDLVVCAGSCDPTRVASPSPGRGPGRFSERNPSSYHQAMVQAQSNLLLDRAHLVLVRRHTISLAQASMVLEQLARYHAIPLTDAARRVLSAAPDSAGPPR